MKYLVTGGNGFIGAAVVRKILHHGHSVINVDALTYAGNVPHPQNENYTFYKGSICDGEMISEIMLREKPDALINLAAETHVDRSIAEPEVFVETNVRGTVSLLESSRKYFNVRSAPHFRFLHVSTDEVFGSLGSQGLFDNASPYAPNSPYSASKASSDHFVRAWYSTYKLPVLITNCTNNFGPYQNEEKFVPKIISKLLCNEKIPIYGNGKNIRDWLYVEDHADALLKVLDKGKIGETYLIGGNSEKDNISVVKEVILAFSKITGNKISYSDSINFIEDRAGHDFRYAIDTHRIFSELQWKPRHDFRKNIESTVEWYIKNVEWLNS